MIAHRESAPLAEKLIRETCARQRIVPGELTLHADRGSSMKSKPVALLLADLASPRRTAGPHVSDDNPFSEAQFKTLKVPAGVPRSLRLDHRRARAKTSARAAMRVAARPM